MQKPWLAPLASVLLTGSAVALPAPVNSQELRLDRDILLHDLTAREVAQRRMACATGQAAGMRDRIKSVGWQTLSVGSWCVTVLTRAGRDGSLRYVTLQNGETTPAIAFDSGFVEGYVKREPLPADAPSMGALLPIADRCLSQSEPNASLCTTVGYVLGARAAQGELVPVPAS